MMREHDGLAPPPALDRGAPTVLRLIQQQCAASPERTALKWCDHRSACACASLPVLAHPRVADTSRDPGRRRDRRRDRSRGGHRPLKHVAHTRRVLHPCRVRPPGGTTAGRNGWATAATGRRTKASAASAVLPSPDRLSYRALWQVATRWAARLTLLLLELAAERGGTRGALRGCAAAPHGGDGDCGGDDGGDVDGGGCPRVGVMLAEGFELPVLELAVLLAGASVVPLPVPDSISASAAAAAAVRASGCTLVVAGEATVTSLVQQQQQQAMMWQNARLVSVDVFLASRPSEGEGVRVADGADTAGAADLLGPSSEATVFTTSGTTAGTPKGCVVSHRALCAYCVGKNAVGNVRRDSVIFVASPYECRTRRCWGAMDAPLSLSLCPGREGHRAIASPSVPFVCCVIFKGVW